MRSIASILLPAIVLVCSSPATGQVPDGGQFQVNSYTVYDQILPSAAIEPGGDLIVVWASQRTFAYENSERSIQGQRYAGNGDAQGQEFLISSYTTLRQLAPSVTKGLAGDFVVVWQSYGSVGSDSSSYSIQARRFGSNGSPLGGQFQVNSYSSNSQSYPAVAADGDGFFVVAWQSLGSSGDSSGTSIQAQRYDAWGNPLSGEFQVNSYTTSYQTGASVAAAPNRNFLVVWNSLGSASDSDQSVQGKLYRFDGVELMEFQVNSYTTGSQLNPSAAFLADGGFIVVWQNGPFDIGCSWGSIQGRRFDSFGLPMGGDFQVNTTTECDQWSPAVSVGPSGDVVVVWETRVSTGESSGPQTVIFPPLVGQLDIRGRRFASDATAVGADFQVNSYTTDDQTHPAVAMGARGSFVVIWDSEGSSGTDSSYASIQGQRFTEHIFADGFESGGTSMWSATVP